MNVHACECTYKYFDASAVREDQCVRVDVALPSTREVNGGGTREVAKGGRRVGWEAH